MQKEKVRIYILARELNMESADLLKFCKTHGIDVKNQLSSVEPEVRDEIVALLKKPAAPAKPQPTALPQPTATIRNLDARPRELPRRVAPRAETDTNSPKTASPAGAPPVVEPVVPPTESAKKLVSTATLTPPSSKTPEPPSVVRIPEAPPLPRPAEPAPAAKAPEVPVPRAPEKPAEPPAAKPAEASSPAHVPEPPAHPAPPAAASARPAETPPAPRPPETPRKPAETHTVPTPPPESAKPPVLPPVAPTPTPGPRMRDLNKPAPAGGASGGGGDAGRQRRDRPVPRPAQHSGIARMPTPPASRPKPQEKEKPQQTGLKKLADFPPESGSRGDGPVTIKDLLRPAPQPVKPVAPVEEEEIEDDSEAGKRKAKDGKRRPGELVGRDARHKERSERQQKRKTVGEVAVKRVADVVGLLEADDQPRIKPRVPKHKKPKPTEPRKGKVPIQMPITVRSLSEAIGIRSGDLLMKLMGQGVANLNINSNLEPVVAETIALECGCELDVKRPLDAEEQLLDELKRPDSPEALEPRAPVVTIMGHVDHGKTSLLDKIRQSNVAATEAGGITQVIRAWRVDHNGKPVTFLDTPGHEAFTKMRARGANVTDIAVIVVAADDGVMPQTEEAISHAKAAGVSIVVAINKVDLPNANLRKTEQQLYGLGLIPDNMGGDVPFVQTSAATGKGIDDLLDTLSVVAELKELKANPHKPAHGTCLEAYLSEGEGVLATVLVRDGTLHRGEVVLCGAGYGRIRAMYDDLGRPLQSAGPSVPVRITGLDVVPNADDPFLVVPDLAVAQEIAKRRKVRQQEAALHHRGPVTLESLSEQKVDELKIILKAEARGSIEAIRKELEKLHHDEVRVRLLHTGIGGITESDVQLALTSPQDTLVVGFNVVPDDRAHALAEERGIKIQQYNIIYNLTDDIRSALEGKLKPREEVVHLGRAVVRETFKISRVGTIAGCYVTQGVIERSAKIRIIRNGVVVYPPPDRTVGLESLKRFKEDAREVREGFECGLKINGYDDIKVDDVIEAYRIEQVQRTLEND